MKEIKNLRNILWTMKFTDKDREIFNEVRAKIEMSNSVFKDLILFCMKNALEDIEKNDFKTAAKELSVIHELPFDEDELEDWDDAWFYKNQLAEYFDRNKYTLRAKELINLLADAHKKI